jgi:hypothetical protein
VDSSEASEQCLSIIFHWKCIVIPDTIHRCADLLANADSRSHRPHPKNMDHIDVSDEDGEFEWEGGE